MKGLLLAVLMLSPCFAADGTVIGTITDAESGEPIPWATVMIEGTMTGGSTDLNGKFEITHLSGGQYNIIASSVGYSTVDYKIELNDNQEIEINIELHRSPLEIGGIVVTGTRTPRYIKEAPVRTEVITHTTIENKSAHNLFEALDGESGIRVEQQCQACNFTVLRMQGLGADHTQVMLDGQPVYSGLAGVYGLQQLSTADIDRIEIVKGAGSALYGSNAVAGAINIISEVPQKTESKIGIEFGEHGTNMYDITAGTRKNNTAVFVFIQQSEQDEIDETGDVNAPGGADNSDGWIDRVRSDAKNAGFNLYIDDIFAADNLIVRGRMLSEHRQGGWLDDNLFENPFARGTERIKTDRYSTEISYRLQLNGGGEVNTNLTYTKHKRDATNDTFLGDYEDVMGEEPPIDLMRPYIANEDLIVANLNFIRPLTHNHRLLTGLQMSHNRLEESGMYVDAEAEEAYVSSSTKKAFEVGVYSQDEFHVSDQIELVAGIRYDYHNSEDEFRGSGDVLSGGLEPLEYNESAFNPRFSIKYAATDALTIRGSVGSGYRVPYGFSEDLHLCSGSPRVYKGGDLKPEKSLSYSLNADYTKINWTAGLNLYRTELKDAIAFADADEEISELGYTYEWQNIDDAVVMGVEFNASVALTDDIVLGARFEVFSGQYDNPREDWLGTVYEEISRNISRYPETSAGMKIEYSPSKWDFVINADYNGKMYIDLSEPADPADVKIYETESFVTLNAKVSRILFDRYKVYVGARNLTDYTQEEKHIDDAAFMYAPVYGRIIYGGVQVSF